MQSLAQERRQFVELRDKERASIAAARESVTEERKRVEAAARELDGMRRAIEQDRARLEAEKLNLAMMKQSIVDDPSAGPWLTKGCVIWG